MQRLSVLALVLAGLALLWLGAPGYARVEAHLSAPTAQMCAEAADLVVTASEALSAKPHLLKACAGQKNRLAIPCQTDRCLPVEPLALTYRPPEARPVPFVAQAMTEHADPDGQFRPPRA